MLLTIWVIATTIVLLAMFFAKRRLAAEPHHTVERWFWWLTMALTVLLSVVAYDKFVPDAEAGMSVGALNFLISMRIAVWLLMTIAGIACFGYKYQHEKRGLSHKSGWVACGMVFPIFSMYLYFFLFF